MPPRKPDDGETPRPRIRFDDVNERQGVFHRRAFLLGGFSALGLSTLAARLIQLQIVDESRYSLLSASNQFNFRLQPPPRGRILDRNGVEVASNRPEFRVLVLRDEVKDKDWDGVIDRVGALIPITDQRRRQILRDIEDTPRSSPVALATDLSWDEFARVNVRAPELPGIAAEMGEARFYPFPGAFTHVIGYVSKISADDLKAAGDDPPPILLHPGFRIGKSGVEKALDLQLRGTAGGQKVEVDSVGRVIREDPAGDIKPVPGQEVQLTLDADIQNRAQEVFGTESGAAVMMDCRSGDILCMYSAPSFDANQFVTGVPPELYRELATFQRKPLLNKALSATYPPGSTFKTMVALAALENGYDPKTVHVCNKTWFWGGRTWHCDKAHGAQDLHGAIKTSCDIYFYQCALWVGPNRIAKVARAFGLGQTFDIGISGQRPGLIPDTDYKRRTFPHDPVWHPGETPSMGIGQGYVNVNALQLCVQASRLANAKTALQPRLIQSIGGVAQPSGAAQPDLPVDPGHLQFVREAMASVANDVGGTAYAAMKLDLGPILMAGKTGTAQSRGYQGGHGEHGAHGEWILRDHAWFIAFAPYDDPRYAMSVLVEHGGFGADAAAPRAREIMKVALLKDPEVRKRIEQPLPGGETSPSPAPDTSQPAAAAPSPDATPVPDNGAGPVA